MKLTIVVPCYNEEKNIPPILERFRQAIGSRNAEVVLVNNGSTDGTADALKRLLPSYPFARSVRVPVNRGYGYGITRGLRAARGDFLGWTHADMQTDPADVMKAYDALERRGWDENVYVKGNRAGRPLSDRFFTAGMGVFETLYLGRRLYDVNAQPNVFARAFFETWVNPPDDFALDLYALYMAEKRGLEVARFPVLFPPRAHGSSHWNTGAAAKWKFIKRTVAFSVKLKRGGIR